MKTRLSCLYFPNGSAVLSFYFCIFFFLININYILIHVYWCINSSIIDSSESEDDEDELLEDESDESDELESELELSLELELESSDSFFCGVL